MGTRVSYPVEVKEAIRLRIVGIPVAEVMDHLHNAKVLYQCAKTLVILK